MEREKSNVSLKQKVNVDAWDANNQKMKGSGVVAKQLNLELAEIKSDILKCYREIKQELRVLSFG
ncbi:MAG: hypothetical protein ACO3VF_04920 [Tamlana sp.]